MQGHVLVWLDQKSARLFRIDRNSVETASEGPNQIVHHQHQKNADSLDDKVFFCHIAEGLTGASGILIAGPGAERSALSTWLTKHCPDIAHGKAYSAPKRRCAPDLLNTQGE
ncbi:MAG: hypothetical protein ABI414_00145 [Devosia sp.]